MHPARQLGNFALIASAGILLIAGTSATSFALAALGAGVLIKYALGNLHRSRRRSRRRHRRP